MAETFFRVRTPEVTSEDFKNEVLIIDLKTGHYHSLRFAAAQIWRLLNAGQSVEACVTWMGNVYTADRATLESDTRHFLAELEKIGLITLADERGNTGNVKVESHSEEYSKPTIDSYGDLQDLLLLDPIHEIAPETGWPHRREAV